MAEEVPLPRKPEWLKTSLRTSRDFAELKGLMRGQGLHTVCEEAHCPNIHECWGAFRTASFMILGDVCTRRCRFCAVKTGLPTAVDRLEPRRVAESVRHMGLRHAHVTMVNRDDLADGGASLMAETVRAIRELAPGCSIEVLTSDFMGNPDSIRTVVESGPDITSHNLETVRRLTRAVRSRSDYDRSLQFLRLAKELAPERVTKSSLMLGLGETARGGAGGPRRPARRRGGHGQPGPVPAALPPARPGGPLVDPRGVRRRCAGGRPGAGASCTARRGRWCAPPTTPRSRPAPCTSPGPRAGRPLMSEPAAAREEG